MLQARVDGGIGGNVLSGLGNGGAGAAATLANVSDGDASATSTLYFQQYATGGAGGNALGGIAGVGGAAANSLSRSKSVANLTLTLGATGGTGGSRTNAVGAGGGGGHATTTVAAVNAGGSSSATATATGGPGGSGLSGASGGAGGNAAATATASNSTSQNVAAGAIATGGLGGSHFSAAPAVAGMGGSATASASGSSTGGGNVDVTARQLAGAGGGHAITVSASGGAGAATSILDAVTGTTSGQLRLFQDAVGGAGGSSGGVASGQGGAASTGLTATNPGGGTLDGLINATGGAGGGASGSATPGNGGDAFSTLTLTNANTIVARSNANGGARGFNFSNNMGGLAGAATADVSAITTGGYRAEATATANGSTGTASALSQTSSGAIQKLRLTASSPNYRSVNASTTAAVGGQFFPSSGGANSISRVTALPLANDMTNSLFGNPLVTAAYNPVGGSRTNLGLFFLSDSVATVGAPAISTTFTATAALSLDVGLLPSGRLIVGLLDPAALSPAFTSLHFTINYNGVLAVDQTFVTNASAVAYFNDRPIDLGPLVAGIAGTADVSFQLAMTSLDNGARFETKFALARVATAATFLDADFDEDHFVDADDLTRWRNNFGTGTTHMQGDANADGAVDGDDLLVWQRQLGMSNVRAATVGVPEPAGASLVIGGVLALLGWQRARRPGAVIIVAARGEDLSQRR